MSNNILVIPDTHFPYCHPETFVFLEAVADRFQTDYTVHVGDLADHHASSYHEVEPECYGIQQELDESRLDCQSLEGLFPKMLIARGNHCDLPKRKCKTAGLPYDILRNEQQLYCVGDGWTWDNEHRINVGDKHDLVIGHYYGKNLAKLAAEMGCSFVQGHMHTFAGIGWARTRASANFGMSVGCLIDPTHPAFTYHKTRRSTSPEQLGCGVILSGFPVWVPMFVDWRGKWKKYLPS